MSWIYKIQTDKIFPLVEMVNKLTTLIGYRPLHGRITHPTYYFYNYGSLRGVDVSQEADGIEVRVTILSNHHDHEMAGLMIRYLKNLTGGDLVDDEGNTCVAAFYDGNIYERMEADMRTVAGILADEREVTMFGPFGEYELDAVDVLPILRSRENVNTRMWRLQQLLKKPYESYFEQLRIG